MRFKSEAPRGGNIHCTHQYLSVKCNDCPVAGTGEKDVVIKFNKIS